MDDGQELKQKRGAVTALALLVSLLFGYAPAAAQISLDQSARLGPAELVKRTATVRAGVRGQADDPGPDSLLATPPLVRSETASSRPATGSIGTLRADAPRNAPLAYRARAPPLS